MVPVRPSRPTACNLFCVKGYVCRLVEVECLFAPCYPQHHCVPIKNVYKILLLSNGATENFTFPKITHNFLWSFPSSAVPVCHEITTGPFGLLYDLVWRIFINMSEELQSIHLANMLVEVFSETLIRNYET